MWHQQGASGASIGISRAPWLGQSKNNAIGNAWQHDQHKQNIRESQRNSSHVFLSKKMSPNTSIQRAFLSALHISFNTPSWLAILVIRPFGRPKGLPWPLWDHRFGHCSYANHLFWRSRILSHIELWGFLVSINAPPCPPPLTLVHLVPSRILLKYFMFQESFSPI